MRSIEPLLRNLADVDSSMDPNFRAQLRKDLQMMNHYRHGALARRWRSLALVGLVGLVVVLFFNPTLVVRGNEWLFGPQMTWPVNSLHWQQSQKEALQQLLNQDYLTLDQPLTSQVNVRPATVESVVGETYFVLRKVALATGEIVMVLSEVNQPKPDQYRMY